MEGDKGGNVTSSNERKETETIAIQDLNNSENEKKEKKKEKSALGNAGGTKGPATHDKNGGGEPLYEAQRRCLQITTETMSLLAMFIGFSLAVVTPWFLLGIFTFPGPYTPQLTTAIWVCCIVSLATILIGSILGNMLWYYDRSSSRWRFIFHCGSPKIRHHWGDCYVKPKTKDFVVEHL